MWSKTLLLQDANGLKKKCFHFGDWFSHSLAHNRPTVTAFWAALGEQGEVGAAYRKEGEEQVSMGVKVTEIIIHQKAESGSLSEQGSAGGRGLSGTDAALGKQGLACSGLETGLWNRLLHQ